MTLNGAIMELVMLSEHPMMPVIFKPSIQKIIETVSECEESERKTGRWIDAVLPNDNGGLPVQVCDQCNTFFPLAYTGGGHNFCPNCGADMRGEQE